MVTGSPAETHSEDIPRTDVQSDSNLDSAKGQRQLLRDGPLQISQHAADLLVGGSLNHRQWPLRCRQHQHQHFRVSSGHNSSAARCRHSHQSLLRDDPETRFLNSYEPGLDMGVTSKGWQSGDLEGEAYGK